MTKKKKPTLWFEEPSGGLTQKDSFGNLDETLRNQSIKIKLPAFGAKFIPIRMGETDKELVLRAELPGFSKDEIKLKVTPKSVHISAGKKKRLVERDEKSFRMASGSSSTSRLLSLPEEVKTDGVKARFENGVLEVVMKKKESKKEKNIEID